MVSFRPTLRGAMAAAALFFLAIGSASAASFDCAQANTQIERAICLSPELSELDGRLGQTYRAALGGAPNTEDLKSDQRAWLRGVRNKCEDTACLASAYKKRIEALAPQTASAPASAAPTNAAVPETSANASVFECDRLAAHPDDPEAVVDGVADDKLNAAAAVSACEAAIKASPDLPRLHFQLGRAYLGADRYEDAIEQFLAAAEEAHGGAFAMLGDVHISGAPGIEADPMLAKTFYERAVASGFEPAKKVLAEFVDKTEEYGELADDENFFIRTFKQFTSWTKNAIVDLCEAVIAFFKDEKEAVAEAEAGAEIDEPAPEPVVVAEAEPPAAPEPPPAPLTPYVNPDIMEGIDARKFDQIRHGEAYTKMYLVNIADNIKGICESGFTDAEIERLKVESTWDVFNLGNEAVVASVAGIFAQLSSALKDPGGFMVQQVQNGDPEEKSFDESMKDTVALFQRHGCKSPGLAKFSENLTAYVKNDEAPRANEGGIMLMCRRDPPPSRMTANDFCNCFAGGLRNALVTQNDRKQLLKEFETTATKIMDITANRLVFQACRSGL